MEDLEDRLNSARKTFRIFIYSSSGFEKAATAGWGMVGTGLLTAASGVAANMVPGVGEVFDVELVTQNALLVEKQADGSLLQMILVVKL